MSKGLARWRSKQRGKIGAGALSADCKTRLQLTHTLAGGLGQFQPLKLSQRCCKRDVFETPIGVCLNELIHCVCNSLALTALKMRGPSETAVYDPFPRSLTIPLEGCGVRHLLPNVPVPVWLIPRLALPRLPSSRRSGERCCSGRYLPVSTLPLPRLRPNAVVLSCPPLGSARELSEVDQSGTIKWLRTQSSADLPRSSPPM